MIGRANAMRGLVALACLAGASCTDRTPAVRAVRAPEPVPAVVGANGHGAQVAPEPRVPVSGGE